MEPAAAQRALERLAASPRPRVLFVSHRHGGGVRRYIDDLVTILDGAADVLLLQPWHGTHARLCELRGDAPLELAFALDDGGWHEMVDVLRGVGISRVHFHHVHEWPQRILALPRELGAPYVVTLHDYFPACCGYHLTDGNGRYCGGKPDCTRCNDARDIAPWGLDPASWRSLFGPWLEGAQQVIAPSASCAGTMRGFFPRVRIETWPHPEQDPPPPTGVRRVLVPGAISPEKGLRVLEACVADAKQRQLPLHFRVVGHVAQPVERWPRAPLTLTGEYPEGALPGLLELERGDVAFFPAQVPETFSYTLSAALDAGLPVVATNLGALPERLARYPRHRLVRWDAPASEMNDALLAASEEPSTRTTIRAIESFDSYRTRYLDKLVRKEPDAPLPALDARWLQPPEGPASVWTFYGLVEEALGRGRAIPLTDIARRAGEADRRLEEADAAEQRARGRKEELETWYRESEAYFQKHAREQDEKAALSEARARTAEESLGAAREAADRAQAQLSQVLQSRSWRLTRPFRALRRLLKR